MKTHNSAFLALGCLGLLLQGIGSALMSSRSDETIALGVMVALLGALSLGVGGAFLAVGRGPNFWFGLLGLLSPLGLLFLCVLEDRSAPPAAPPAPA